MIETKEHDCIFMKIKEIFRRDPKTTWGKNELVKHLDLIHDEYNKSKQDTKSEVSK